MSLALKDSLLPGLLIAPFEDRSKVAHGTAGDLIRFRETRGGVGYDIATEDTLYRDVWTARLVPFDSAVTPQFLYAALTSEGPLYREGENDIRDRAALATRARQLFPNHPYREAFAALECRAVHRLEAVETDGKTSWPKSRACITAYLRDFPSGGARDELEWLGVQLEHAVYEYEGDPTPAMAEVRAYTGYRDTHPRHTQRTEIEFAIARLCYMIQEMLADGPTPAALADRDIYRAQADEIYTRLAASNDPGVASRAAVMLYNLRHGRHVYIGPNEWK